MPATQSSLLRPGTRFRIGDIGVLLAGTACVAGLTLWSWGGSQGDTAVIRAAGQIVETSALTRAKTFSIRGPLGITQVEIQPGRARVAADPSPRQICVKQGWLTQSGQAALCLPNQVSLEIRGRAAAYDTLGY
ncbi:MAG: NusG domain II-containing protein [Gammaproteobacteria bacterium]|nr:NusG domain II-containing protein [Gammaproteobacteria bacterium]